MLQPGENDNFVKGLSVQRSLFVDPAAHVSVLEASLVEQLVEKWCRDDLRLCLSLPNGENLKQNQARVLHFHVHLFLYYLMLECQHYTPFYTLLMFLVIRFRAHRQTPL